MADHTHSPPPVDGMLKTLALEAANEMIAAKTLAANGEAKLAIECVKDGQAHALKAKRLLASALRMKVLPDKTAVNAALGHVEDARLFASAATTMARHAMRRRTLDADAAKKAKASGDAVGYLSAAADALLATLKGGGADLAMRKLRTAVKVMGAILDEATKAADPFADDAAAAKAIVDDIAKRTTWLADHEAKTTSAKMPETTDHSQTIEPECPDGEAAGTVTGSIISV